MAGLREDRFRLEDFELYRTARSFRRRIYDVIADLPPAERYCLDPQMRRAVVSVTNNIAEGHGRWHYQENSRFCRIARGSLEEIIDDLTVCLDQRYGDSQLVSDLKDEAYTLVARINGYIAYLQRSKQGGTDGKPADRTKS